MHHAERLEASQWGGGKDRALIIDMLALEASTHEPYRDTELSVALMNPVKAFIHH